MVNVPEAREAAFDVRAVKRADAVVEVYADTASLEVTGEVSFDTQAAAGTALNHFAAAVAGGVIEHAATLARQQGFFLEDLEARLTVTLANPLTLLGVRGYTAPATIARVDLTLWAYAEKTPGEVERFLHEALGSCFMWQVCERACEAHARCVAVL
jgi:hypothetical protein